MSISDLSESLPKIRDLIVIAAVLVTTIFLHRAVEFELYLLRLEPLLWLIVDDAAHHFEIGLWFFFKFEFLLELFMLDSEILLLLKLEFLPLLVDLLHFLHVFVVVLVARELDTLILECLVVVEALIIF